MSSLITRSHLVAGKLPDTLRIELKVEIDGLARRLTEIGSWLTEHGCSYQVFHCVRVGSHAVIGVEFDVCAASLLDHFRQRFSVGAADARKALGQALTRQAGVCAGNAVARLPFPYAEVEAAMPIVKSKPAQ